MIFTGTSSELRLRMHTVSVKKVKNQILLMSVESSHRIQGDLISVIGSYSTKHSYNFHICSLFFKCLSTLAFPSTFVLVNNARNRGFNTFLFPMSPRCFSQMMHKMTSPTICVSPDNIPASPRRKTWKEM